MQSLYLTAPGQLEIRDEPEPVVGGKNALIRVRAAVITREDMGRYTGVRMDGAEFPCRPGRDVAGVVEAVGAEMTACAVGDRVAASGVEGGFSELALASESQIAPLPDRIRFEEGAIAGLLPSILQGLQQCDLTGKTVLVSGAGATGLLVCQLARASGASAIFAADLHPLRIRKALETAADHVINASTEDTVRRILDETGGVGVAYGFECAGDEASLRNCEGSLQKEGVLVVIGALPHPVQINTDEWGDRSLKMIMGRAQPARVGELLTSGLRLVEIGALTLRPVLTHVFPLRRAADAFRLIRDDPNRSIRVVLTL